MPTRVVITEDTLVWYGADDGPPAAEICLVRRRTGELLLVASSEAAQVADLWMWAVIPPPPQFILQRETL